MPRTGWEKVLCCLLASSALASADGHVHGHLIHQLPRLQEVRRLGVHQHLCTHSGSPSGSNPMRLKASCPKHAMSSPYNSAVMHACAQDLKVADDINSPGCGASTATSIKVRLQLPPSSSSVDLQTLLHVHSWEVSTAVHPQNADCAPVSAMSSSSPIWPCASMAAAARLPGAMGCVSYEGRGPPRCTWGMGGSSLSNAICIMPRICGMSSSGLAACTHANRAASGGAHMTRVATDSQAISASRPRSVAHQASGRAA